MPDSIAADVIFGRTPRDFTLLLPRDGQFEFRIDPKTSSGDEYHWVPGSVLDFVFTLVDGSRVIWRAVPDADDVCSWTVGSTQVNSVLDSGTGRVGLFVRLASTESEPVLWWRGTVLEV